MGNPERHGGLVRGSETILLIDDERMILEAAGGLLRRLGYAVLTATNGQEAVDIAKSYVGDIHLAMLDMRMPVMDGAAAFPLLKEARPQMRIVIWTGYANDQTTKDLLRRGADAFLPKPSSARDISETVRRALDNPSGSCPSQPKKVSC